MKLEKKLIPTLMLTAALSVYGLAGIPSAHAVDYDYYDYDGDSYWNEDEWVDYSYDAIDYDDDGFINDTEWNEYTTTWYEPFDTTYDYDLGYYDTNEDGLLDENEYTEAYDADLYDSWDLDNDGYFDENEYNTVYNAYGDYDEEGLFDW